MKNTNYNIILKNVLPIIILLFFILVSELRIEGTFGGLIHAVKYLLFLLFGLIIIIYTLSKQIKNLRTHKNIIESRTILIVLLISTFIAISSFWFPKTFFDKELDFIAVDDFGTELTLSKEKFMLKTHDYEWITIDRGNYILSNDSLFLDKKIKEIRWSKRTNKYLIKNKKLIPIYISGIERDTTDFLKITLNKTTHR